MRCLFSRGMGIEYPFSEVRALSIRFQRYVYQNCDMDIRFPSARHITAAVTH